MADFALGRLHCCADNYTPDCFRRKKMLSIQIFVLNIQKDKYTVCLKGPVKKYLPIAWARKQPIT